MRTNLPHELYRSLTWDHGKEMADHRRFTLATDIKVYCLIRAALGNASCEYEWAIEAIFPQGNRPLRVFASQAQRDRSAPQRKAAKDIHYETQLNDFMKLFRATGESAVESGHAPMSAVGH